MLFSAAIISTAAVGLVAAFPMAKQSPAGPSIITGKAFQLAVLGDLREMDPENAVSNAWVLSLQRVATGLYAATIEPRNRDKTKNPTFYLNATAGGGSQTLNLDIPGAFPLSAVVSSSADVAGGENVVSFSNNQATKGLSLYARAQDGVPALAGPAPGSWAVCRRNLPRASGPVSVMMPRFVKEGQSAPEGCVSVELVVLCKNLDELLPTDRWNHDHVREVRCVAN